MSIETLEARAEHAYGAMHDASPHEVRYWFDEAVLAYSRAIELAHDEENHEAFERLRLRLDHVKLVFLHQFRGVGLIGGLAQEIVSPQVVRWGAFNEVDQPGVVDIGGWGGHIEKGQRWLDYLLLIDGKWGDHFEALRGEILKRRLKRGGDWHQFALDGVPVFDDGVVATFSFRGWGDLMAAIWSDEDGRDYSYMDFYMDSCIEDSGIELSPPL